MHQREDDLTEIVEGYYDHINTMKAAQITGEISLEEFAFVRSTYWKTLAKKYENDETDFGKEVQLLAQIFSGEWNKHSKYK